MSRRRTRAEAVDRACARRIAARKVREEPAGWFPSEERMLESLDAAWGSAPRSCRGVILDHPMRSVAHRGGPRSGD